VLRIAEQVVASRDWLRPRATASNTLTHNKPTKINRPWNVGQQDIMNGDETAAFTRHAP
jgi:hypothetical protein